MSRKKPLPLLTNIEIEDFAAEGKCLFHWNTGRKDENEKRTKIVMAAIEKNGEIDVQEFFKNLNKPRKTAREKLVMQLHWEVLLGSIFTIFGLVVFIALGVLIGFGITKGDDVIAMSCCLGIPALALGAGLLIAYFSGRKMMKELKD